MLAVFDVSYEDGLAVFDASYESAGVAITVVTDIDAGNVDASKVVVTNAESDEPTVYVDYRTAAGGWRHLHWAVENAEGKRPIFEMNWASRIVSTAPTSAWALLWTQDFVTWTKAPSRTLASGKMTCQFTDPLPAGRVYLATQPLWPQSGADTLAAELLTTYSSVASPTASADVNGVYNVSPAETDENSRAIGEHDQYSIKLEFGGSTTDGGPKRRLVMLSGIHAAGESHAHTAFRAALDWIINDSSQAAIDFRSNWDVYCYFNLTPNGYYGGNHRTNFRVGTDPNRNWDTGSLSEIAATKSAITTDLGLSSGGRWDAMFSWHAFYTNASDFQCWVTPEDYNAGTRSAAMQAMFDHGATVFDNAPVLDTSSTSNTDVWWAKSQGAKVSFDTELQQNADTAPEFFESVGTKWMTTLQLVDADGLFWSAVAEISGSAEFAAVGQTIATASFSASGQSDTNVAAQSLTHAAFASDGTATSAFAGQNIIAAAFSSDGSATTAAAGQSVATSTFSSAGAAVTALTAQSIVVGAFNAAGSAQFDATGQALAHAEFSSTGVAAADWIALTTGFVDAAFAVTAAAAGEFAGSVVTQTAFAAGGVATASVVGQSLAHGAFAPDGVASTAWAGQHVQAGTFAASADAQSAFAGQAVVASAFAADGQASSNWLHDGRDPVVAYLLRTTSQYVRLTEPEVFVRLTEPAVFVRVQLPSITIGV